MHKEITAWAFVGGVDNDWPARLAPYGNGHEAQFPVFPTRAEALAWRRRHSEVPSVKLARVTIRLSDS